MSDPFGTLDLLLAHVWAELDTGASDAAHPFRIVCLATSGSDGPEARMVALRRADHATDEIEVHSDLRTAKIRALETDPRASLLAWDPVAQLQVRIALDMRVRASDQERWADVPAQARLNYGTDPAPGTAIAAPERLTRTPDLDRFAVLLGRVRAIDVVSLSHDPHRRARFDGHGRTWVAP